MSKGRVKKGPVLLPTQFRPLQQLRSREAHPLKHVPVHKAAYDHTYMIETFGHNQPNPILQYDNNPVPMTEDGKIDIC